MMVMNNYFGVGIDADLCLDFHIERQENPDKFNSRYCLLSVHLTISATNFVHLSHTSRFH